MRCLRIGMTAAAAIALLAFEPWGQQARANVPDGGPGGACQVDSDCGICGWVCSAARGNICVPAIEGDPGHCTTNPQCPCIGQVCDAGVCSPGPKPMCWCNGDCPVGDVCDQLLFTCHPSSPIYCGRDYNGYDYGAPNTGPACGCNAICGESAGLLVCQPQVDTLPDACASDLDCGSCYQKKACLGGVCVAASEAGWCNDSRDVIAESSDGGSPSAAKSGCSTAGTDGPALLALLLALLGACLRRRTHAPAK